MKFTCPICGDTLSEAEGGAARCCRGHSFDRAREGYYNLLVSNSPSHGDNREMLLARRRFLDSGAYRPMAEALTQALLEEAEAGAAVLDMGCGEGYYTDLVERSLHLRDGVSAVSAFDISKEAVRLAARRNKNVSFAVASSYRIPCGELAFDLAFNVFSPLALSEVRRVLRRDGGFIMVIPDRRHLFGLKAAIYDEPYENEPSETSLEGFRLVSEKRLAFPLHLDTCQKINDLFMMTPYAYRTKAADRERLLALQRLECSAEFVLLTYRKL